MAIPGRLWVFGKMKSHRFNYTPNYSVVVRSVTGKRDYGFDYLQSAKNFVARMSRYRNFVNAYIFDNVNGKLVYRTFKKR